MRTRAARPGKKGPSSIVARAAKTDATFRYRAAGLEPLVAEVLAELGARATAGDDWTLLFDAEARGAAADPAKLARGDRFVGSITGVAHVARKDLLAGSLERARKVVAQRTDAPLYAFAPRSFVFPEGFEAWRAAAAAEPETTWISKIARSARGEGVAMVTDVEAVRPDPERVVQEYLATPHLIDGCKYTLRVYVVIASLDPLRVWVFPDGFAMLTTRKFTMDRASLGDPFVHVANWSVLQRDAGADAMERLATHVGYRATLRAQGHDDDALFAEIRRVAAKTILAVREPLLRMHEDRGLSSKGSFALLGFDVLVDRDLKPWLIEVNFAPSLAVDVDLATETGRAVRDIKHRVVRDLFGVVGLVARDRPDFQAALPSIDALATMPAYERVRDADVADLRIACRDAAVDPTFASDDATVTPRADGDTVMLRRAGVKLDLNDAATIVWRALASGRPMSEAIAALAQVSDEAARWAESDAWETLASLLHLGALRRRG